MVQSDPDQDIAIPRIELRLTGPWRTPEQLAATLDEKESDYKLEPPGILVHRTTGWECELGGSNPDDQIADLFAQSGRLSVKELREIDDHAAKVHLSGPGGSIEHARAMVQAAAAIVRAGASGIMVDNSGSTHGRKDFLLLADDKEPGGLYWTYVALAGDRDELWSVGMHCLGFRDAEIHDTPSRDAAAFVLHNFLGYCYQSGNTVTDGEAIGDEGMPSFRLRAIPCTQFEEGSPFHNPYGLWRLEPLMEED